jgi:hypothetical protein
MTKTKHGWTSWHRHSPGNSCNTNCRSLAADLVRKHGGAQESLWQQEVDVHCASSLLQHPIAILSGQVPALTGWRTVQVRKPTSGQAYQRWHGQLASSVVFLWEAGRVNSCNLGNASRSKFSSTPMAMYCDGKGLSFQMARRTTAKPTPMPAGLWAGHMAAGSLDMPMAGSTKVTLWTAARRNWHAAVSDA